MAKQARQDPSDLHGRHRSLLHHRQEQEEHAQQDGGQLDTTPSCASMFRTRKARSGKPFVPSDASLPPQGGFCCLARTGGPRVVESAHGLPAASGDLAAGLDWGIASWRSPTDRCAAAHSAGAGAGCCWWASCRCSACRCTSPSATRGCRGSAANAATASRVIAERQQPLARLRWTPHDDSIADDIARLCERTGDFMPMGGNAIALEDDYAASLRRCWPTSRRRASRCTCCTT